MATDLTQFCAVSYGLSVLQLKSYSAKIDPVVRDGVGRVLSRVEFEGEGELTADNAGDLQAKIAAVMLAWNIDGGNLIVTGLGGVGEFALAAATCFDNGPHVSITVDDGPVTCSKMLKLKAWALCPPPGITTPVDVYRVEYTVRADGLLTVRRSGQLIGANNVGYATSTTIPAFRKLYPLPTWSVTAQYTTGMDQDLSIVNYRLEAVQMAQPMAAVNANVFAVEQQQTITTDRDADNRKLTTYGYDILMPPGVDPIAMLTAIRPVGIVLRESAQISVTKENRLQASFTILASADATALMNLTQTVRVQAPTFIYEELKYIGADPILVQGPAVYGRVTQSGSAIANGVFLKAPSPIFNFLSQQPSITYVNINDVEKQTNWEYDMFAADDQGNALSSDQVNSLSLDPISRTFIEKSFKAQTVPLTPSRPAVH